MSDPFSLLRSARAKLCGSALTPKTTELRKWVLLKSVVIHSINPPATHTATSGRRSPEPEDDPVTIDAPEALIYPDAESSGVVASASEAQWLDSLWGELGDDDDDFEEDPQAPSHQDDEDDDGFISPMSSSDDLSSLASSSLTLSYPYLVPYPPYHPPLISPFHFASDLHASYHDPPPYLDDEDVEDMPVPDAIEDTSDDESESPSTPSSGRSTPFDFVDPVAVPLPIDDSRHRQHGTDPYVYNDGDASFLQSFNLDAVPYPNPSHSPFLEDCS
ncbi:hypothetical protein CYLTODRAFT_423565 [Cylindrobasidium torrendii FP15055 ss-10]|uniref:Uncharacterized protein n=1 Tax=Cylindrobasidium torrendii FP15055 ss-10 TaxID=1314674 RepID=A0A0D7B726_9AGAR|nr:hypothetical protein CYLTODRAFT_423565 [Cylindrobasidium torrendii FP15055 ss-10]